MRFRARGTADFRSGSSRRGGARRPQDEVATFVERGPRSLSSRLLADHVYRSRSIILLPDFFDDLDRSYPGEFGGLFSAFDGSWGPEAKEAIRHALGNIPAGPPLGPGGSLGLLSTVTSLMASLAADGKGAGQDEGMLVSHAKRLLSAAVEEGGAPPSVDELARRLYVSRSRLCDAFRREAGQSVGAYARQLRMERACRLLEGGARSVSEVAVLLGYPSPSAFCHAFSDFTGLSPRAWMIQKGTDPFLNHLPEQRLREPRDPVADEESHRHPKERPADDAHDPSLPERGERSRRPRSVSRSTGSPFQNARTSW